MKKPLNFVLIGRSGCGKGTQAELLIERFGNFCHISTGDLFRDLSKQGTDTAIKVKKVVESGGLPIDDLATTLWMHEIAYKVMEDQGIMADGFPRRINEAKSLDKFLEFLERKENTYFILIDISRQEAFGRLTKRRICKQCGELIPWVGEFKNIKACPKCQGELVSRMDDKPEAIESRLNYFDQIVSEVIEYYKEQGKLITVNGEQPIEDVFKDILKAIKA
jgi:adenylate kinase